MNCSLRNNHASPSTKNRHPYITPHGCWQSPSSYPTLLIATLSSSEFISTTADSSAMAAVSDLRQVKSRGQVKRPAHTHSIHTFSIHTFSIHTPDLSRLAPSPTGLAPTATIRPTSSGVKSPSGPTMSTTLPDSWKLEVGSWELTCLAAAVGFM